MGLVVRNGDVLRVSPSKRFTIKVSGQTHRTLSTIKGELENLFDTNLSMDELIYAILMLKVNLADYVSLPPGEGGPKGVLMSNREKGT